MGSSEAAQHCAGPYTAGTDSKLRKLRKLSEPTGGSHMNTVWRVLELIEQSKTSISSVIDLPLFA
jgi:hypothetical protein